MGRSAQRARVGGLRDCSRGMALFGAAGVRRDKLVGELLVFPNTFRFRHNTKAVCAVSTHSRIIRTNISTVPTVHHAGKLFEFLCDESFMVQFGLGILIGR